jgi:hypothetical protein
MYEKEKGERRGERREERGEGKETLAHVKSYMGHQNL